jgi:hypothetical protein
MYLVAQLGFFSGEFLVLFFKFFDLQEPRDARHGGGDLASFDVEEEVFPAIFVFLVDKGLR